MESIDTIKCSKQTDNQQTLLAKIPNEWADNIYHEQFKCQIIFFDRIKPFHLFHLSMVLFDTIKYFLKKVPISSSCLKKCTNCSWYTVQIFQWIPKSTVQLFYSDHIN